MSTSSFTRTRFQNIDPPANPPTRSVPPLGSAEAPPSQRNYRRKVTKVFTLDLSVARAAVVVSVAGSVLIYKSSTNAGDLVQLQLTDDDDAHPWRPGDGKIGYPFARLLVTNAAQAGAVATFEYSTVYPDEDVRIF